LDGADGGGFAGTIGDVTDGGTIRAIEQVKAAYFTLRAQAMVERGRPIKVGRFGHATALLWPGFNRVYALGADDLDRFDDLLAWYRDDDAKPVVEVAPFPGHAEVERRLGACGFRKDREQAVFCGPAAPARDTGVAVRWIEPHERPAWAALYVKAYEWKVPDGDPLEAELVDQYAGPHWHLCVAEVDGRAVAMGALFTGKPIAYLANAATLPDHRGRGCQGALIARRRALAAARGHDLVASDAVPGSSSARNLQRCGVPLSHTKSIWIHA
jgi:GNAT superfamily N-acetyltransferase